MSYPDEATLLRQLLGLEWLDVFATTYQDDQNVLLQIVFSTSEGAVALSGKAHSLGDGTEAFSLRVHPYGPSNSWTEGNMPDFLVKRNVKQELEGTPLKQLLIPPRDARFYTDPLFEHRIHPRGVSLLDNCSGIELTNLGHEPSLRFLVVASTSYPCTVEIATDQDVCKSMLTGLERTKHLLETG